MRSCDAASWRTAVRERTVITLSAITQNKLTGGGLDCHESGNLSGLQQFLGRGSTTGTLQLAQKWVPYDELASRKSAPPDSS